jgi:hypothetical protein
MHSYIWDGSIPQQSVENSLSLKPSNSRYSKDIKKTESSLAHLSKDPTIRTSPSEVRQPVPYYSIKYLGVTRGQMGILSKRAPIPYLSPLEACKDVPLTLINASVADRRPASRIINKLITVPTAAENRVEVVEEPQKTEEEDEMPNPELYDEYVIHTYARPKALVTVRKSDTERMMEERHKPIEIPYHRVGISGWKLSRPKTAEIEKSRSFQGAKPKVQARKSNKTPGKINMPEFYNEPYLQYLAEKKKKGAENKRKVN